MIMGEPKQKIVILLLLTTMVLTIILIIFTVKGSFTASPADKPNAGEKPGTGEICVDPYQYNYEYIPMPVRNVQTAEGELHFQQISSINESTDKIVDSLYSEYSGNLSAGIKDCYCQFDEEGKVFFSRISEDDYERYQLYTDYAGEIGAKLVFGLENIPEHRHEATGCVTFQKDSGVEIALLTTDLYSNVMLNILMSKDFSKVETVAGSSVYKELTEVLNTAKASKINQVDMANIYHYQQRIYKPKEDNIGEEHYIYYSYFVKDGMEYLVQFISNYTVMEGYKEYMIVGDLQPQEVCRDTYLKVLNLILDTNMISEED
jgi:hypothetical protein